MNDPEAADRFVRVATSLFGAENVETFAHPPQGAEDFSVVLDELPGAMAFFGVRVPDRDAATAPYDHSSHALHADGPLAHGASLRAAMALDHLCPESVR